MATYATVSAKLGKVTAATRSISQEIYEAAAKAGHAPWYMWGMGSSSEHATGRALDLMVRNKAAGDWIRNYIWQNRARLRLQHVIWYQRITSTVTQPGVVRKMADRGSVTENHLDHVHVLFFAGSYQAPGKTPSKPPTTGGGTYTVKSGDNLSSIGRARGVPWPDIAAANKLRSPYQIVPGQKLTIPRSGSTPTPTRPTVSLARLVAAAKADPPKKGTPVSYASVRTVEDALVKEGLLARSLADGHFGTATVTAYAAWQRRLGYVGRDADGIPGSASLKKLGDKYGFTVTS